jgi:hypothetical protein
MLWIGSTYWLLYGRGLMLWIGSTYWLRKLEFQHRGSFFARWSTNSFSSITVFHGINERWDSFELILVPLIILFFYWEFHMFSRAKRKTICKVRWVQDCLKYVPDWMAFERNNCATNRGNNEWNEVSISVGVETRRGLWVCRDFTCPCRYSRWKNLCHS